MEIRGKSYIRMWQVFLCFVVMTLSCACNRLVETDMVARQILTSAPHTLVALTPEFSLRNSEVALHKQYLLLDEKKYFPIIGILRVDGKSYRFMGGDSLRVMPLIPLSDDSCGWLAKYSYLYPGVGWKENAYDDKLWHDGMGAFGTEDNKYTSHTIWGANKIYVRRHFTINNKNMLKKRKLYLRYICDDGLSLYCNGKDVFQTNRFTSQTKCVLLNDFADYLKDGDNVIASCGYNIGGPAMMDFGLYMENDMYNEVDTACLEQVDVQATQTHYTFRCGGVELSLNFVSSTLLSESAFSESPVGFMSYRIKEDREESPHDIEILFDVDMEWLNGKKEMENCVRREWRFLHSEGLCIGSMVNDMEYSSEDGHVIFSQKLCGKNKVGGVLLFGYVERDSLQYEGENLMPYWNRKGNQNIQDMLVSMGERYLILEDECNNIDYQWNKKAFQLGNENFAEKIILSYREFLASHRFVETSDGKKFCFADTLGSVRDAYCYFPSLMFFNRVDWMKNLLDPIFTYSENGYWKKEYPPYDIGLYPIINRQVKKDDCGVEVAADMLMLVVAIVELEKNFDYARMHWGTLCRWADYLKESILEKNSDCDGLVGENDERVKRILGWMAYRRLTHLKKIYD